jgi:hypothetical protein
MRVSLFLMLYSLQPVFHPGIYAQQAATLSPPVQKYVRVNTPRVVLQRVRVIDGTGQPPAEDQNCWCGSQTRLGAPDENCFTMSRTGGMGV